MWKTSGWAGAGLILVVLEVAGNGALAAQSPQFRGTAAHVGVVKTAGVEELGGVAWRFRTEGVVRSSPALADGVVYVGSSDGILYALDAGSGRKLWAFDTGAPVASSPAVADGVVLISNRNGDLYGVHARDGYAVWHMSTGPDIPLPWGHEGWDYIQGSASLAHGLAYWGSGDGHLFALRPRTGEVVWSFEVASRIRNTPAVAGDLVAFGDSDGYVYALDARTGTQRWRFASDGVGYDSSEWGFDRRQISASVAIEGDEVFVGARDATLYALNAADGSIRWRVEDGSSWVIASPAVDERRVFSARSSSGNFRALDRDTGEELWVFAAGAFVYSSPVLVDNTVYVGQGDGEVSAHDADSGDVLWSYKTGGSVYSTPVVHDGRIYVGSDDGYVYAFQAAVGPGWRRAVYFDEVMSGRSVLGRSPNHARARDYFVGMGYEALDTATVASFLRARIEDGAPSVVVFAMDGVPPELLDGTAGTPLLRRYLDAGGKVVWMGYLPDQLVMNREGVVTGLDSHGPETLLDIDLSRFDGDEYATHPTPTGRAWGMDSWWVGIAFAVPTRVDEVLAADELGRAVSWVKRYGGGPGTGFVHVRPTSLAAPLPEIQRVAEYGLGRRER